MICTYRHDLLHVAKFRYMAGSLGTQVPG
eukprot:SAG31_NODE_37398_length_304_cov_1.253659_1_plen_28_part_10